MEVDNQISDLSRGSGDLAKQVAEFGRRLGSMEMKVEAVLDKALSTAQPLAAEIEELSALVKQLADRCRRMSASCPAGVAAAAAHRRRSN